MAKETLQDIMESELFPAGGSNSELLDALKFMENHAYSLAATQIAAYAVCERLDMREGHKLYKPFRDAFDNMRKYLSPTGVFMDMITKKWESDKIPREPKPKRGLFGGGD